MPWNEALVAGSLIGSKVVVNEFVAFIQMMEVKEQLSEHSLAIVTFALCGFANVSTMAILIGGLGSLAPERRTFISKMGFRAITAGVLANLMSAPSQVLSFHFKLGITLIKTMLSAILVDGLIDNQEGRT